MPFSEEFHSSPAWEHTGEAALEDPEPQPIVEGYRGKVAIVTGGATGLGRASAIEFGRRGCKVAFCYLDLPGRDVTEQALLTETTLSGMGVHVYASRCDVRDRLAVEHFVNETIARLGGLHYVVNNAGIAVDGALWRLSERAWAEVLETNVTGAFNCIRASAPHLRAQHYGKIVSVSAHTAGRPGFGVANYAASKAAVEGLTRAAAVDLGSANINVNAVAPGFIRTERMELLPSDVVERSQKKSMLGRLADPEDIARVIAFLCSEEARHITGQTLVVDGGMSLG
jgi:3-oxoacyl-[acyl-carrier protein] reductase